MRLHLWKLASTSWGKAVSNNLSLTLPEAPRYISHFKEKVIYKKLADLNSWYTRVLGLDEVKLYQDRVVDLQERLLEVQERRREVGASLSAIRARSNELQDQLHKVRRQDDLQRFLDLMRDEAEVLRRERDASDAFVACDREEREVFTAFTNAIRDSHEKQRAQLEYTKYLGLILSIVGTFLAYAYSTLRKDDLKGFIEAQIEGMAAKEMDIVPLIERLSNDVKESVRNNQLLLRDLNDNRNQIRELQDRLSSERKFPLGDLPDRQTLVKYGIYTLLGYIVLKAFL